MTESERQTDAPGTGDMTALDALFAQARATDAAPSDDFLARIAAEGAALQPRPRVMTASAVPAEAPSRGAFRDWIALLGGWPALGGLAAAGLTGVWIGIAPPDGVSTVAAAVWGDTVTLDLSPDADPFGTGG